VIVKAGQHIYGNVEKEVSPNRVGGFQTLAYTKAVLTEEESAEIERRLVYHFSEAEPVKLLFFSPSSGKFVISRLVALPDLDRFGRKGIYLAHSFIFSREDFIRLNCNPFIVLRLLKEYFVSSITEALQVSKPGGTDKSSIVLEVTEQTIKALELEILKETLKWDSEELKKLAYGAVNCLKLKEERKSLALAGTSEDIQIALEVTLSLLPNELRLNCSFDTYSYGCNPIANYFWAFGYPSLPPVSPGFILIDANQRRAQTGAPIPISPYERWLFANISERRFLEIASYKAVALELQHFLLNVPYDQGLLRSAPADFLRDYLGLNWSHVVAIVERTLKRALGANLMARLRNHILTYCRQLDASDLLQVLLDGFDLELLANKLYRIFRSEKPSQEEIMELGQFLKKTRHDLLALRVSCWKQDLDGLRRQLEALGEERGREATELLIMEDHVAPADLLSASGAKVIIKIVAELAVFNLRLREQIPQIVKGLIALHQEILLIEVIPFLGELNLKQLREIEGEIEEQDQHVPKSFLESLEKALASRKAEKKPRLSLKGLFKKASEWRRKEE
jgi:hypothetical protein